VNSFYRLTPCAATISPRSIKSFLQSFHLLQGSKFNVTQQLFVLDMWQHCHSHLELRVSTIDNSFPLHVNMQPAFFVAPFCSTVAIRGCIHKFPDWSPGARTASGTALCHWVQLYRYFISQSSEFCRHNPLCCFLTSVCIFVSVYFVSDSVRKLLDTPYYVAVLIRC
jgi:hypothetical protein